MSELLPGTLGSDLLPDPQQTTDPRPEAPSSHSSLSCEIPARQLKIKGFSVGKCLERKEFSAKKDIWRTLSAALQVPERVIRSD